MSVLDFLLHWAKPYRYLRGGVWSRLNQRHPLGKSPWYRNYYLPLGARSRFILNEWLDEEDYR